MWPDRDIAAGCRGIETPYASLPTPSPSQPHTPARKAGFLHHESRFGRETDSPLEGDGFEPSVPRRKDLFMQTPEIAADREHRGADPRENSENADLAPLGGQRRCSPAAADRPNWPGFAFALARRVAWQEL